MKLDGKLNKFRENLRKFRENAGFTPMELADKLHLKVSTYRNYENTYREPDYDTLIRLAHELNTTVDDLLGVSKNANSIKSSGLPIQTTLRFDELSEEHKLAVITMINSLHNHSSQKDSDSKQKNHISPKKGA